MEDKLQKLYQTLNDQGLYTKTYDDFVTQFSDDTKRQTLHSVLTEKGLYTKSYEDFDGQFFSSLKKKDETVEPLSPASSAPVEDTPVSQKRSALQSKYAGDVEDVNALDYDKSLPQSYTLKDLSGAKTRQAALYEKSILDLEDEMESRAKELAAKAETQEELDVELKKLSDEITKRAEALPSELEKPKYIAPEDVKVIDEEVANIMQSGAAFDTKNKHLEDLIKHFEDMAPEDMRPKVRGELNQIIAKRAMTHGGQLTPFAAKTEGKRMFNDIEEKRTVALKEWMGLERKKDKTPEELERQDELDHELRMYGQAGRLLERLDRLPDDQGSFVQGLAAPWEDGTVTSLGISDVVDAATQLQASNRVGNMRGTDADRAVLNVLGLYQVGQSGLGDWYSRGKGLSETLPFMAQFALTGGLPGVGSATAKKMAAEQVKRTLMQRVGKFAAKTATQAAVRTPLLTTGYQRALEGMRGTTTFDEKTGSFVIDETTRESVIEGIAKGAFTNFTEAFFESGGEAVGKGLNILASKFGVKLPKAAPWAREIKDRVAFNGFLGEFVEELPVGFIQGIVTEGQSISEAWKQLKEDAPDILFTTAVISGVFGGMSAPGSIANARRESRITAAIGEDALVGIDEAVKTGGRENVMKAMDKVWSSMPQENKTPEMLKDLIKYAGVSISEHTATDFQATIAKTAQVEVPETEQPAAEQATAPAPAVTEPAAIEPGATEKDTSGGVKTIEKTPASESIPETEILDNGDVLYHNSASFTPPTPEVKEAVRAEIERLNSLSEGQKMVIMEDGVVPKVLSKAADREFRTKPGLRGLHIKGDNRSYINISRVGSVEDARATWIHESMVHGGVERMFKTKEEYVAHTLGVVKYLGGRDATLAAIEALGGDKAAYASKTDAMLGEEYMAFLSKKVISDPDLNAERVLSPEQLNIWQKFVKTIKDAIANYMGIALDLTEADITNMIVDAMAVARSQAGGKTDTVFARRGVTEEMEGIPKTILPTAVDDSDVAGEVLPGGRGGKITKEQRKEVAITPETSGHYANLTEDKDGNLVFFHYSKEKRDVIDPAMYGTNPANLTSKDELRDLSMVGGSFFYTTPDYSEGGTGDVVHVIKVRPEEVYDLQQDKLNFYDEARRRFKKARGESMAFGPNAQMAWIAQVAQDNGFKIGVAEWGRNGQLRAQIARPLKPDETYSEAERKSGGTKAQQWNAYRSNADKGWRKKGKGRSEHSRLTDEWIKKEEDRLPESSMTREELKAMLETGEYAILTGENPNNNLQDDRENHQLNKAAEQWLRENGFTPIPVVGKYDGKGELSYIVPGMTLADARRAQTALGQEMIAHSSGMLKPGGKAMHPRVAGKVNYPKEATLADINYASLVKDNEGKPLAFSLEYDWDKSAEVKVGNAQEAIIAVSKSLGLTFPGVKVIVGKTSGGAKTQIQTVLRDAGATEKAAARIAEEFTMLDAGQTIFFRGKPIAVVINEETANERTAGHEMWEVILRDAFGNDPKKLQEFAEAIDKQLRKGGYVEVADKLKEFAALYDTDLQFSEYMAEFGGYLVSAGIDMANLSSKEKSLLDKIKDIINQFAKALTGSEVFLRDATPENIMDFMTTISQKIAAGEDVSEFMVEGEAPSDAEGLAAVRQSISIMAGVEAMKKWGLSPGRNNTRLVAEALQARQRRRYGLIGKDDRSSSALKKISRWMADEVSYFSDLMGDKSGVGWYGKLYQQAITEMAEIFPELKDDYNARDMFTILVAVTSDGQKVMRNFQLAAQAYSVYRKGKKRVPTTLAVMRTASIRANLKNINDLLAKYNGDIARIKNELLRVESIRKINAGRKRDGLEKLSSSWPADFEAPLAASVFGPKLGMFYANLSGMENYPTLDRWWSRMFNRYRGTLIPELRRGIKGGKKLGLDALKQALKNPSMTDEEAMLAAKIYRDSYADKGFKRGTAIEKMSNTLYKIAFENINDTPFNTSDRAFMYDAIVAAQKLLKRRGHDFSIADIQAILWYYEKNLYKKLGVKANIKGVSYSNAAKETVRKYKDSGDSFDYEIGANEDVSIVEYEDEEIEEIEIEVRRQKTGGVSPIATQLKDVIQKRIDRAYAIGMGEGKIVGEIEGRKGQKKEDLRDEKSRNVEVRKMFREMSKFISATLKESPFAKELSNAQVRTLVNAARRVNENNVDEFMDLVSRLVDNREYAKAIDDARQNQRAIRKRVNDGRYYGQDTPKVADFISMPIRAMDFSIEDLNKYNDVATLLLAGRVPTDGIVALRSYVPPVVVEAKETGVIKAINTAGSAEAINKLIDDIAAMEVETLASFRRVLRLTELLSDRISNLKFEEDVVAEMESRLNEISAAMEARAEEMVEEAAEERAAAIAEAQDLIPSIKRDLFDEEVTDEEWAEVSDFKNITEKQMESMTLKQILLYNNIMYGLTEGFVNKELYSFLQEIDTRAKQGAFDIIRAHLDNGYAKIRALGDRLYKHNLTKPIAKWIDPLRKNVTSIITMFDLNKLSLIDQKLLGIYDKNVRPIYESFVAPLASAVSKMEHEIAVVSNKYWTAAQKVNEDTRNLLGVLMREMDFRSNPIVLPDGVEYTWDTLPTEHKKDISRWEIEERAGLSRQETPELEKLYKQLPLAEDGNIDIEASLEMLFKNKDVEALYNATREILAAHVGRVRVTTAMRGGVYEGEGPLYFPRFNRDFQNPSKGEAYEIQNIREIYSPFKAIRKRAKATYSRVHTRNVNEYRLDNVVGVFVADVNRDYYLSRPMTAINTSLQRVIDVNGSKSKDVEKVARGIQSGIINRITTEMGEKASAAWLSKLVAWQRTFSLAQPERILKELPTNTVRYWLRNPGMKLGLGHDKRWRAVVRMQGSPIALKKITRWEEANTPTEDAKITIAERGAVLLYTISDTIIGRSVYGNEFSAAFKLKTGEAFDIDRYLSDERYRIDNKEALAHADAMAMAEIETLFNSQSWVTAPSKHKYIPFIGGSNQFSLFGMKFNPTVSRKSSAAKVLGYMQSFNFGESSEAMNSILTLIRPGAGPSSKMRAARLLANLAATNYMYMSLGGFFYTVLVSLFDDDDDMSEAISAYFSLENQRNLFIGSVATLGMSRYGNVMRTFLTVVLGTSDYFDPKQETVMGKVTKYTLDAADQTIMVRPLNPGKRTNPLTILDNVGLVYGAVAADIWRAGLSIGDIAKKVMDEGFDALSLEEKEAWLAMSALNQGIGLLYPNFISPVADKAMRLQARGIGPSYTVTPSKGVGVINGIDVLKVYDIEGLRGITDNKVTVYSSGNYESGNGPLELTPKQTAEYQNAAKAKFEKMLSDYVVENEMDIAIDAENKNLTYERKEAVTAEINKLWSEAKAETRKEMFQYKNFQDDPTYQRALKAGAVPDPITSISRTFNKVEIDILKGYPEYAVEVNKLFMKGYLQAFEETFPTDASVRGAKNSDTFDTTVKRIATDEAKKARDAVALKFTQN